MGLIKFSAVVGAASGKIGGNVFARNASGAYVRTFTMPINPNTTKQQGVRTDFADLISSWKSLTAAKQQAWEDMAPQYPYTNRLGESSQYTGQQLYNHLNMNLKTVGATILDTPLVPETFSTTSLTSLTMVDTAGVLTTADVLLSAVGAATESVIINVTTSMSGGITKPAKGAFKQVTIVADASVSATLDIIVPYQTLYGDPQLGTNVFTRVFLINTNTGQRLNLGQALATVTGT